MSQPFIYPPSSMDISDDLISFDSTHNSSDEGPTLSDQFEHELSSSADGEETRECEPVPSKIEYSCCDWELDLGQMLERIAHMVKEYNARSSEIEKSHKTAHTHVQSQQRGHNDVCDKRVHTHQDLFQTSAKESGPSLRQPPTLSCVSRETPSECINSSSFEHIPSFPMTRSAKKRLRSLEKCLDDTSQSYGETRVEGAVRHDEDVSPPKKRRRIQEGNPPGCQVSIRPCRKRNGSFKDIGHESFEESTLQSLPHKYLLRLDMNIENDGIRLVDAQSNDLSEYLEVKDWCKKNHKVIQFRTTSYRAKVEQFFLAVPKIGFVSKGFCLRSRRKY